jgi:hypothetical protein
MRMEINIAREVIYRRPATYMGKSSGRLFLHDIHYHHFASKINGIGSMTR